MIVDFSPGLITAADETRNAVIGGVVGAIVVLVIVALILIVVCRRRRYTIERAEDYEKRNECK